MKEIRIKNNNSQKELAKLLNLSSITYSHYETQDTTITIKHLNTFCNYYNINIDYILGLSDNLVHVKYMGI